jgi:hypothetical protein
VHYVDNHPTTAGVVYLPIARLFLRKMEKGTAKPHGNTLVLARKPLFACKGVQHLLEKLHKKLHNRKRENDNSIGFAFAFPRRVFAPYRKAAHKG